MSNVYREWANEQRDKLKRLTKIKTAPNKALHGKWNKEQINKAKKLLDSWLQTHQKWKWFKITLINKMDSLIHKLKTDDTSFLNELDSKFKQFCEHKSRQSKDVKTP